MAEEKKTETAEVEKKADAETEKPEEAEERKEEPLKPDYEAELGREKELGKEVEDFTPEVEKTIADEAFKEREEKREEEEKPLTAKELKTILAVDRQTQRKELLKETISEKARKLATSEAEANLIIEIHKNRTFPEGLSLDEQLEEACAIANRKPFMMARKAEIARAQKSKETVSKDAVGTYHEPPELNEPQLSAAEKLSLTGAGFVWDGKQGLYVKTLKDKILVYNPKTKKRKVIAKAK